MVFTWHFITPKYGHFAPPPIFPLSIFAEGHGGVALFMTLSGYLFARLLDGRDVRYRAFYWNRFIRLAPLLLIVIVVVGIQTYTSTSRYGRAFDEYLHDVMTGLVMPTLPNGGWSVTAELHFYLLLPFLLLSTRRWRFSLLMILAAAIGFRAALYWHLGEVQKLAYYTIVGRIDQFLLGIMAFQSRDRVQGRTFVGIAAFLGYAIFVYWFDLQGGFYTNEGYPSPSPLWIIIPTVEGVAFAVFIAWYDGAVGNSGGGFSRFLAAVGSYSYSIYLLHYFVVFRLTTFIDQRILELRSLETMILVSPLCFLLMVPIGHLSYRYIESPFLRFRRPYLRERRESDEPD